MMSEDALGMQIIGGASSGHVGLSQMMLGWVGVKSGVKRSKSNWLPSSNLGRALRRCHREPLWQPCGSSERSSYRKTSPIRSDTSRYCTLDLHAGGGVSVAGLVVMRFASQRVSGKVSNIAASSSVMGI